MDVTNGTGNAAMSGATDPGAAAGSAGGEADDLYDVTIIGACLGRSTRECAR